MAGTALVLSADAAVWSLRGFVQRAQCVTGATGFEARGKENISIARLHVNKMAFLERGRGEPLVIQWKHGGGQTHLKAIYRAQVGGSRLCRDFTPTVSQEPLMPGYVYYYCQKSQVVKVAGSTTVALTLMCWQIILCVGDNLIKRILSLSKSLYLHPNNGPHRNAAF